MFRIIKVVLDTSYQILANCPVMMPDVIGYFTQKQFEEVLESASGNMLHQCQMTSMRKFTNCLLHLFPGYRISTDRHRFSDAFISSSGFHRLNFPLWLKSSFRVYSRQLFYMCELAQCVIFSSAWTVTGQARQLSASLSCSTALVLSPTDSGYSHILSVSAAVLCPPLKKKNLRTQQNH